MDANRGLTAMVDMTSVLPEKTRIPAPRQRRGLNGMRQTIWDILLSVAQPVSAYWLIDQLRTRGKSVAPPTVYRALSFLQSARMVHRVESLNAFIACTRPEHPHHGQFLICTECGQTEEISEEIVTELVAATAATRGFVPTVQIIELNGTCRNCVLESDKELNAGAGSP
ncbi:MAG: ferric uptake regulator, Fur family [Rhodospirillales bacterium]|nr:ferric uptake regulator, Fur family [Rhodospirillales bacterium]